jgi:hypothetical protein
LILTDKKLQFLQFLPYVSLSLANKSGINHPLVFSGLWVKEVYKWNASHRCL